MSQRPPSPYKGLIPYSEEDAPFFFGRSGETEIITANLMASRLTLLYGASGVGKSSVLRAGVAHHLRELARQNIAARGAPEFAVVLFSSWRDDPIAALSERVRDSVAQMRAQPIEPPPHSRSLGETLQRWAERIDGDLLIILDQFEEYFLYHGQEDGAGTFAAEFPRALRRPDLRVSFLISIREDALAKLDRFKGRVPNLFDNYLRIEHLERDAARAAIEKPLGEFNQRVPETQRVAIEPGLVAAVLDQTKTGEVMLDSSGRGAIGGDSAGAHIETPYLQLVMTRLWNEEMNAGSCVLHLQTLNQLGGAARIVRTHLDETMRALSADEQSAAARVFRFLVTPSGAKIAHTYRDLAHYARWREEDLLRILDKLAAPDVRILRPIAPPPDQPQIQRYEIFHDVLAPAILDWRARFTKAQEQAEANAQLARERQRVTRLRLGLVGLSLVLIAMVVLAVFAFAQWNAATRAQAEAVLQRDRASQQARISDSRRLAAQAVSLKDRRFDSQLLLSTEASRWDNNPETRGTLLDSLVSNPQLETYLSNPAQVGSIAFSPDGKTLAGGRFGVYLWDMNTRQMIATSTASHAYVVYDMAFSPDGKVLASASADQTIRLWDAKTLQPIGQPLMGHANIVSSVAFSPDGKMLASGSWDETVMLWDVGARQPIGQPLRDNDGVTSIVFSPDGKSLASGSDDGTVIVWDVMARQRIGQPLKGSASAILTVAISPDGKTLAAGTRDGIIFLWDLRTRQPMGPPLEMHGDAVNSIAFSPDGRTFASGSLDKTIILWDVNARQPINRFFRGHSESVSSVAFSPDGKTLVSLGFDRAIVLWDLNPRLAIGQTLIGHSDGVRSVAFRPDGKVLASGSQDNSIILWDVNARQRIGQPLKAHTGAVLSIAFSPDGKMMASGSGDKTIILWDSDARQPIAPPLRGHNGSVESIAFSPDGKTLASGSSDATVILWDIGTHQPIGEPLRATNVSVRGVTFSPDGKTLATANMDGSVILWDVNTHQRIKVLPVGPGYVTSVAFSPDGKTLAIGKEQRVIMLWDVAAQQFIGQPLEGHTDIVWSVAFSPDGKTLASASQDKTVILWDVETRQPIGQPLTGHSNFVSAVTFSPDGKTLASGGWDNNVILWDVGLESWQARACRIANRNMTRAEWARYVNSDPIWYDLVYATNPTCPGLPLEGK